MAELTLPWATIEGDNGVTSYWDPHPRNHPLANMRNLAQWALTNLSPDHPERAMVEQSITGFNELIQVRGIYS